MVAYEISVIIKAVSKAKMVSTMKRTCEMIMANKGYIESIQFLGTRALPLKIHKYGQAFNRGSYFIINYHTPYTARDDIKDNCKRDVDIIRETIFPKESAQEFICSLHDEIKPPAYRADVAKMITEGEERMPKNLKNRKKVEDKLKDYIF